MSNINYYKDIPTSNDWGGSLLLPKKKSFFMYNEDVDFCLRAKLNKIKCVYLPSVIISHKVSSSLGGYYSRKKILMKIKSAFLLYKKYYSKPWATILLVKYCMRSLMSIKL